jgi:hypothetical protein
MLEIPTSVTTTVFAEFPPSWNIKYCPLHIGIQIKNSNQKSTKERVFCSKRLKLIENYEW